LKEKGVTQADLARRAGMAYATVNDLYHMGPGKKGITFKALGAICRELGCQPGDLLEYVPDA